MWRSVMWSFNSWRSPVRPNMSAGCHW